MILMNSLDPDCLLDGSSGQRMMDGSNGEQMMDGGGVWVMALFGLLLLAMLGVTAFLALRAAGAIGRSPNPPGGAPGSAGGTPAARDALDQRLVRGEISPEEYETTRTLLSS